MFVTSNKKWHNKLLKCQTEKERNALILSSGTRAVSCHIDIKSGKEFFRPCIGEYVIYAVDTVDNELIFSNQHEAIAKGNELRTLLAFELKAE